MTTIETLGVIQTLTPETTVRPVVRHNSLTIGDAGLSTFLACNDPATWRRVAEAATALAEAIERRERTQQQQSDEEAARDDARYLTDVTTVRQMFPDGPMGEEAF